LAVIGAIGLIAIQFVPVEKSNPPVVSEPKWDSPQTKALAERACCDCHSNQTKWPWYANLAPVSWLVVHDVEEGREALNFSEWGLNHGSRSEREADEAREHTENEQGEEDEGVEVDELVEEVQEGEMPLRKYIIMHPEARLTDAEIQTLITGFKATFSSQAEGAMAK
jgi:hypothetical protein